MNAQTKHINASVISALIAFAGLPVLAAPPMLWSADDSVTRNFVGDITFSDSRVTFKNRKFLQLAPSGQVRISDTGATRAGVVTADIFRVQQPADPAGICGAPVTYIATWKPTGDNVPDRRLALFSSQSVPTPTTQSCNQFAYHIGR